ncbi:STAS-like domain-containing protein [Dongia sedimenti]|uniref:STAS-like domain-containing protein n=1 Tax=Dongia sedimenti TaxID=3064282 RepID=A0ABU0YWH1_9PROT|nr:STAS-like domain-containing protein [Rhodospirillaceae bacterium R-7]
MMIDVATAFSPYPAGRFRTDGPFSGEEFREKTLVPALAQGGPVVVRLAGTKGYGSSFLEEAFGGLVRHGHFTADELHRRLSIEAGAPEYEIYKRRVDEYIRRATFGSDRAKARA